MNRSVAFEAPYLLGFEHTRALIERAGKAAAEGYPPYNVEDLGDGAIRITLALAGFAASQIDVSVEERQLSVVGRRDAEEGNVGARAYLHRGIAARNFARVFILADGLEVVSAKLDHGLIHIDAARPAPTGTLRRIPIQTAG